MVFPAPFGNDATTLSFQYAYLHLKQQSAHRRTWLICQQKAMTFSFPPYSILFLPNLKISLISFDPIMPCGRKIIITTSKRA